MLKFKMATMMPLRLTLDPMGISDFIFFFQTTEEMSTLLGRNVINVGNMVLNQIFVFGANQKFNMAASSNYVF